jgi:hypothetical protein
VTAEGVGVGVGASVGEGVGIGEGVGVNDGVKVGVVVRVGAGVGDGVGVELVPLLPQPAASIPTNTRTSASVAISLIRYPPRWKMPYSNYSCFASGFQERREKGMLIDIGECGEIGEEMGARMTFSRPKATHGVLVELDEDQ